MNANEKAQLTLYFEGINRKPEQLAGASLHAAASRLLRGGSGRREAFCVSATLLSECLRTPDCSTDAERHKQRLFTRCLFIHGGRRWGGAASECHTRGPTALVLRRLRWVPAVGAGLACDGYSWFRRWTRKPAQTRALISNIEPL